MISISSSLKRLASFRTPLWKGLVFGAAWYFLPSWFFILVAAYLYFVPFFHSSKFLPVFIAIMGMYVFAPNPIGYALIGGILFGWLIAIRELLFIDRRSSYEVLIFAILFFHLRIFDLAHGVVGINSFLAALVLAGLIAWMVEGFIDHAAVGIGREQKAMPVATGIGLLGFFAWQVIMVSFMLPVDFVYQSLLAFVSIVGMIDIVSEYLLGDITKEKILLTGTFVFSGLVLLLAATPFGL